MLHKMRMWDARTAAGVDHFAANSQFVRRRIWKCYRRDARVIYPPVDTAAFPLGQEREEFYLTASRLVPYKRVDVLVDAFAQLPERRLVVVGDGPMLSALRRRAPPNVSLVGYQEAEALGDWMRRARAFLFAGREDFGIALVEAQAAGAPLIAFGRGGAAEIVRALESPDPTGVLFDEQTPRAVVQAIRTFEREAGRVTPAACRQNALRFGIERFRREFAQFVGDSWRQFSGRPLDDSPDASDRADHRLRVA
jgi:glycosyltransferase involved in cell wall biosynthesis